MIAPTAETRALYESMTREQVLELQTAFEAAAATVASRLALIAEVLARKAAE